MKIFKHSIIVFSSLILIFAGCREEIISPNNPVANINEPVKQSIRDSYTFSINAEQLSLNQVDYPNLTTTRTKVIVTITDYSSGYMDISILSREGIIFQRQYGTNFENESSDLTGLFPTIIKIKCENFSGKIKVQLSSL